MSDWYASIYKGFILAGIISFIIGFFTQGDVSLGSYIAGYSVIILGIMVLIVLLFSNILKFTQGQKSFQILYKILFSTGPFLLMLGVIGFVLYLMITYKDNIIHNRISNGYHTFSNITIILLLIQLYIVYTNISEQSFQETGNMSKVTSSIIYLLGVLTSITSIILFTILKYFTTDGFLNLNSYDKLLNNN
jgi:hypothetical protein